MTDLEQKVIERDEDTAMEDKNDGGLYPYDPAYDAPQTSDLQGILSNLGRFDFPD